MCTSSVTHYCAECLYPDCCPQSGRHRYCIATHVARRSTVLGPAIEDTPYVVYYWTHFISLLRLAALLKYASLFAACTCAHLTALSTSQRSFELWTCRFPNLCIGSTGRPKLTNCVEQSLS